MINNNLKFMKSKEIAPHEFYFLDEALFQTLSASLKQGGYNTYKTISTIGNIEFEGGWVLSFLNYKIPLNISRVNDLNPSIKKEAFSTFYIIYGELKWENNQAVILVHFSRNVGSKVDLDALRKCTLRKRELVSEALNQDSIFLS